MVTVIGSQLTITDPTPELTAWCKDNLVVPNPEYQKKRRMGLWTGNTPSTLYLYEVKGNTWCFPSAV